MLHRLESAPLCAPGLAHKGFHPRFWARLNFSQNTDGRGEKAQDLLGHWQGSGSGERGHGDPGMLPVTAGMQSWHRARPGQGWGCSSSHSSPRSTWIFL